MKLSPFNQARLVWLDLLFGCMLSFALILPRARKAGLKILPWTLAVILTANIALLFMLSKIMWLETRDEPLI